MIKKTDNISQTVIVNFQNPYYIDIAMKILVIHGPNIPLLGKISSTTGTRLTLDKVNKALRNKAKELNIELKIFQFYDEARIVKTVSRNRNEIAGLLINPCALVNTCYSLRELLSIIKIPTVEIHLSEFPFAKESFDNSVLKDIVLDRLIEPGTEAYVKGLDILYNKILPKGFP